MANRRYASTVQNARDKLRLGKGDPEAAFEELEWIDLEAASKKLDAVMMQIDVMVQIEPRRKGT